MADFCQQMGAPSTCKPMLTLKNCNRKYPFPLPANNFGKVVFDRLPNRYKQNPKLWHVMKIKLGSDT